MAIVDNFWLKGQKKKLGGSVIYQAMGQTRQRALATTVRNPRTQSQMNQRVKWSNLVNLYRANQSWMKYAFETKKETQSDYNKFMSLNVTGSNIFLTKDIAAAGGCVVQAYLITQGSIPSIETIYDTERQGWVTNIFLGPDVQFSQISVAAFSRMLLDNNPAMQEGDQLSFIRMTQLTNADTGFPFVIVRKYEVVLSLTNTTSLWDYLPNEYIGSDENNTMSRLMVNNSGNAGGFVLILSRTRGGKTYVSSQRIVVANNSSLISAYSSQAALNAAIASYGDSDEPFLTSTTANIADAAYVPLSINEIQLDGVNIIPGTFWQLTKADANKDIDLTLSGNVSGTTANLVLNYLQGGHEYQIPMTAELVTGNNITFTLPAAASLPTDAAVTSLTLSIDGGSPVMTGFTVPNAYTIEGLE